MSQSSRPRARRKQPALVALSCLWLSPLSAWALSPAENRVVVDVSACQETPLQQTFLRALEVEARSSEVELTVERERRSRTNEPAAASGPKLPRVQVEFCALEAGAIEVSLARSADTEQVRPPPERRRIDLRDVPAVARARTAAVAVAEIARWLSALPANVALPTRSPADLAAQPAEQNRTAKQRTVEPREAGTTWDWDRNLGSQSAKTPVLRWSGLVGARAGLIGRERTVLYGGVLGLELRALPQLVASVASQYQRSTAQTRLGQTVLDAVGAEVGADWVFLQKPELRLGARLEWHSVWVRGKSVLGVSEAPVHDYLVLAFGRFGLHVPISKRIGLYSEFEIGSDLRGIDFTAGGEPALTLSGLATRAGAGIQLAL